ncbi:DUF7545 family protein [Halococcus sp. AFM35]|uniref:DUF7545 family protein n=1 Tax=Halococcus sp. AFM35 TaxID=3421653 RepID=UPI003EBFBE5E
MTEPTGETISFDIEGAGKRSELELPRALVEALADETDSPADVVADIAQFDVTRRAYEMDADATADRAIERDALALFETHFGVSFEELVEARE